jgi:hypothetical protein
MRVIDCEQGSPLWLRARQGKITGSRIIDVLDQLKKGGEGANRRNYRIELIAERLAGKSDDHYVSKDMEFGTDQEPFARAAYEIDRGVMVDQVGFVQHPVYDFAGSSPDGLISKDGAIEIKVPRVSTHIKWLLDNKVPDDHEPQCVFNMRCCDRRWIDFISYQPLMPDGLKLFVVRLSRDEDRVALIDKEVARFNEEVEGTVDELKKKVIEPAAEYVPEISDWHNHFGDELAI